MVETGRSYFVSIALPEKIVAGLRVARIGNSSVRYEVGLFREDGKKAVSQGYFVHVYVDRATLKPQALAGTLMTALSNRNVEVPCWRGVTGVYVLEGPPDIEVGILLGRATSVFTATPS